MWLDYCVVDLLDGRIDLCMNSYVFGRLYDRAVVWLDGNLRCFSLSVCQSGCHVDDVIIREREVTLLRR